LLFKSRFPRTVTAIIIGGNIRNGDSANKVKKSVQIR
jgi:hypothetical protein